MSSIKKTAKDNSRKRFNDEQIKLLEIIFEKESRPGIRMKQHLANKLGLQPRQVEIWFQNKRARSKRKELERQYDMLKTTYKKVAYQFESLRIENHDLLIQLQRLKQIEETSDKQHENKSIETETSKKTSFLQEMNGPRLGKPLYSDCNKNADYFKDEADILDVAQMAVGFLTLEENFYSFESSSLISNTSYYPEYWNF